jgi:hypothetical protein
MIKEGFSDEITIRTQIRLSWADAFKALLGTVLFIETRTLCENAPGRMQTVSKAYTSPLIKPRQTQSGRLEASLRLCVCGHSENTHTPCCVSACGCDGYEPEQ